MYRGKTIVLDAKNLVLHLDAATATREITTVTAAALEIGIPVICSIQEHKFHEVNEALVHSASV